MEKDDIKEISIDESKRLRVIPSIKTFPKIFRSATEIHRDQKGGYLFSPSDPKDWTYSDWFEQILKAVKEEYGCQQIISSKTRWVAVPEDIKIKIIEVVRQG